MRSKAPGIIFFYILILCSLCLEGQQFMQFQKSLLHPMANSDSRSGKWFCELSARLLTQKLKNSRVLIHIRIFVLNNLFVNPYSRNNVNFSYCIFSSYWAKQCLYCIIESLNIDLYLNFIIRWPNVISNKDLWRVTGQEDINLEIRKRKLRWIGHTLRKEDGEIPKAALQWNPQGSRKRGRPKNSWRRSVIKEVGRSWNGLRFLAAHRSGKNS